MKSHFIYSDRVRLQYNLDNKLVDSASVLAKLLHKARSSIYYEILNNRTVHITKAEKFNDTYGYICEVLNKFPFTCNGCVNKRCSHKKYEYLADEAHYKALHTLKSSRSDTVKTRHTTSIINKDITEQIKNGQSIYTAKLNSGCPYSESTIRRYIEKDRLLIKRHNLPKAVRFKVKKEYNYNNLPKIDINTLNGRTYEDFKRHIESKPLSKIIQVDSIIGKRNDSYAILTIYFLKSHLQLGIKYDRKHPHTARILRKIYDIGKKYGYTLFDTVLGDNGSEFRKLYDLEFDSLTGEFICKTFYTDPYRSCQKAECERNHGLFRRILPKGNSFSNLSQERIDEIFSNINSYPRSSLGGKSPYDVFTSEYNSIILSELNIFKIQPSKVKIK